MNFPSRLIENAVNEISKLPGIGKKSALRLVLFLLKQPSDSTKDLTDSLNNLRSGIVYCRICFNVSDSEICSICSDPHRDKTLICVVEDIQDVLAIENTNQYRGLYHVLGGIISPMEGIGPSDLTIEQLVGRVSADPVQEIILALSATMQGDTTAFYITKKVRDFNIKISTIARGISVGSELEYTDEVTLAKSILARVKYEQ